MSRFVMLVSVLFVLGCDQQARQREIEARPEVSDHRRQAGKGLRDAPTALKDADPDKIADEVDDVRRVVYSPDDGVVSTLNVRHGQNVAVGDVLLVLRNDDLELKIVDVEGEIDTTRLGLDAIRRSLYDPQVTRDERTELTSQIVESERKLENLKEQLALLRERHHRLTVLSPVEGMIHAPKAEILLPGRTVSQGQILMAIREPADAPTMGGDSPPTAVARPGSEDAMKADRGSISQDKQ